MRIAIILLVIALVATSSTESRAQQLCDNTNMQIKKVSLELYQNSPNPFDSETTIKFYLVNPQHIEMKVYDVTSRLVKTIVSKDFDAGEFEVKWNGSNESGQRVYPGLYFYELSSAKEVKIKRLLML